MPEDKKLEIKLLRERAKENGITISKTRATKSFLLKALKRIDFFLQYKNKKLNEKESFLSLIETKEQAQNILEKILLYKEIDKKECSLSEVQIEELKLKGVFFKEEEIRKFSS